MPGTRPSPAKPALVRVADKPEDYQYEGLQQQSEAWEDGLRTDMGPGSFEWWYFDAHLNDGSLLVIIIFTKPMYGINKSAAPFINVRLVSAEGETLRFESQITPGDFRVSTEACLIEAGRNQIMADGDSWHLEIEVEAFRARLKMRALSPPWRPGTGKFYFGDDASRYFAWLAQIPHGEIEGEIEVGGQARVVCGSAYHDHNWGTVEMARVWNNWWWSRAKLGSYTVIAVELTASAAYDHGTIPLLLVTQGEQILCADWRHTQLLRDQHQRHTQSNKTMAESLHFKLKHEDFNVDFKLKHHDDLFIHNFLAKKSLPKRLLARMAGIDPWYHRLRGRAQLNLEHLGQSHRECGETIYEYMQLGPDLGSYGCEGSAPLPSTNEK